MRKPQVDLNDESIRINFHDYVIDIIFQENRAYETILLGQTEPKELSMYRVKKFYNSNWIKDNNVRFEHKRIKTFFRNGQVLAIDKGIDGRLFLKVYEANEYNEWRGNYFWIASYFENHRLNQNEFYLMDMKNPVRVWK